MIAVELINEDSLEAPDANEFQLWVNLLADKLNVNGEVCIKVVDQQESQALNREYRNKDKPTNVLSFPSEIPEFVESTHLGDLAICSQVVVKEAEEQNKINQHHWAHMCIHGVLHLLGYDHIEDSDAEEMESLEIELLAALNINNPY